MKSVFLSEKKKTPLNHSTLIIFNQQSLYNLIIYSRPQCPDPSKCSPQSVFIFNKLEPWLSCPSSSYSAPPPKPSPRFPPPPIHPYLVLKPPIAHRPTIMTTLSRFVEKYMTVAESSISAIGTPRTCRIGDQGMDWASSSGSRLA